MVDRLLNPVYQLIGQVDVSSDSFLYSRLYGVFCSAFIYLPVIGIQFLVKRGQFDKFMHSMISKAHTFVTTYDRRLFTLALISLFKEKVKQEQLDETAIACLDAAVLHLHIQRMEEQKKLAADHISSSHMKGASHKKGPLNDTERQDIAVYNLIKGKTYNLHHVLMDDSEEGQDEVMEFLVSPNRAAQKSIQSLSSPIKDADEFGEFNSMFAELKSFFKDRLTTLIVDKLSSSARLVLPGILQCKKISTTVSDEKPDTEVMPRRIVKVKARAPTG